MRLSTTFLAMQIGLLSFACHVGLAQELDDVARLHGFKDTVLLWSANIETVIGQDDLASQSKLLAKSRDFEGGSPFWLGGATKIIKLMGADPNRPASGDENLDLDFPVITFVEYPNQIEKPAFAEYMNRFRHDLFLSLPEYAPEWVDETKLYTRSFANSGERITSGILDPSFFFPAADLVVLGPRNVLVSALQHKNAAAFECNIRSDEMKVATLGLRLRNGSHFAETRVANAEFSLEGQVAAAFKKTLPLPEITNAQVIVDFEKLVAFTADIEFKSIDDAKNFEQSFDGRRLEIAKEVVDALRPVWEVAGEEEKAELNRLGDLLEQSCTQMTVARNEARVRIQIEDNELVRETVFHAFAAMAFWHSAKFSIR